MFSQLIVTIPKIEGISPEGLKRDIDYLILQQRNDLVSTLTTRVVVSDKEPAKIIQSKQYEVVSKTIIKPQEDTKKDLSTKILSRVSVDYPEQTVAEVTLEALNLPDNIDGLITSIKEEIKAYCKLFQVDVFLISGKENKIKPNCESTGLELSMEVPKMSAECHKLLKMDIECVVMRANLASFGTGGDPCSVPAINHKVVVTDHPRDSKSHLLKVSLLGEIEKRYYEIMWDIRRAIRKVLRSDSPQSPSDDVVHGLNIFLPTDQNLFNLANDHYSDLKYAIIKNLQSDKVNDLHLQLCQSNGVSHPELVCAKLLTSLDCNYLVRDLCENITCGLAQFFKQKIPDDKQQPEFSCVPKFQSSFKQDISEGHIQYIMSWQEGRFMMHVSYPEALSAHLQDLKTCSEKFQEGVLHILSKLDLPVLQAILEDPSSCYSKGSCFSADFTDQPLAQASEMNQYKTVLANIDSTRNKHEIVQQLLFDISKQIYE